MQACSHEEPSPAPEPVETWWERTDTGEWWSKGGKDPKRAELVSCDELAPGFATIRVSGLRASSNYQAYIPGCDVELTWASWWPSQLFQKQLSKMPGCSDCELEAFDEGFTLAESVLHLRVVRHDGRLIASFDPRWRPDLDEVVFARVPFVLRRSGDPRGRRMALLRSDCPDGSHARRCLQLTDGTEDEARP